MAWAVLGLAILFVVAGCQGEPSDRSTAPDQNTATSDAARRVTGGEAGESTTQASSPWAQHPCGPQQFPSDSSPDGRFIAWTPDGSHIVFDDGTRVMMVDVAGTRLDTVVDANPGQRFDFGFYADLSPDGSRIVYSSCEYRTEEVRWPRKMDIERDHYHYEIATVALDGSDAKRLTENDHIDHYPVWSPDMTYIAFLSADNPLRSADELRVVRGDGSGRADGMAVSSAEPFRYVSPPPPPEWTPDGERIAFFRYDEPDVGTTVEWPYRIPWTLYTVRVDGTGLTKISDHTGAASWSPDGQRIAVARVAGEDVVLETIASDGSDSRRLIRITDRETSFSEGVLGRFGWGPLSPVSWSPDGRYILYVCEAGVCVVDLDGNLFGQSPAGLIPEAGRPHAAWSPDGSRIAVRAPGLLFDGRQYHGDINPHADGAAAVFTMALDGSDVQVLVRGGPAGGPPLVLAQEE